MRLRAALSIVLLSAVTTGVSASDRTVSVQARLNLSERTSLAVSSSVLQFVVPPGGTRATASLEFTAGVRTLPGREVLVVAECIRQFDAPLAFAGEGDGLLAGELTGSAQALVARYTGSGQRRGRVIFTLDGVPPGTYAVPVRLFISVL